MKEPIGTATMYDELKRLLTAFPRRGQQDLTGLADVYKKGLVGVETDALRGAVDACIQNDEFFPKVARLRGAADEWMRRNRGKFAPAGPDDPDRCNVCGARAYQPTITRPKLFPTDSGRMVYRDEAGNTHPRMALLTLQAKGARLVMETVESQRFTVDHNRGPHNVHYETAE